MSLQKAMVHTGLACLLWGGAGVWAQVSPSINPGSAVNAASATPGRLAPGSIAAVYGNFLLATPSASGGAPLPTSISGLSIVFGGGLPAPLFYASGVQVNLQVPWEMAGQSQTTLTATLAGQSSGAVVVPIAPLAPGIFATNGQGTGQGAILDAANRLVDASHPAIPGSTYLQIYCTGLGPVTHQPPTGYPAPGGPLAETLSTPEVTIGGVPATVLFSGLAPGTVGEYQVNVRVPVGAPVGSAVPVAITMGGASSNTVTIAVSAHGAPQSAVTPMGGISLNGVNLPLLYTWNTPLQINGSGWGPGEIVAISLHGPLNWAGTPPADLLLGPLVAHDNGNLEGLLTIPYDRGVTGPTARIPRPGVYQVVAAGSTSGAAVAVATINITVATQSGAGFTINWGSARGGRVGVFPGPLADVSPERVDPEWITVWRQAPITAYGTIVDNGTDGTNQPSRITASDFPGTHYAHDANFFMTPDPAYQWLVGTANYTANAPAVPSAPPDVIEIEWETQNGGNTSAYGQGVIGIPVWANPTSGDRVFVVGRWIMDAGHPDNGDSTEIHPPRLMASMRARPAALDGSGTRAAQVDIYVSGHGGGANQVYPPGLTSLLDQEGYGGGRIEDVLDTAGQQLYYGGGPAPEQIASLAGVLIEQMTGLPLTGPINSAAGPSAFPWGAQGTEELPINDMDYDFDVPLPPPPPGATAVVMRSVTHPQHNTTVNEVVTYTNPVNGLPTTAHVHLPYLGADNGIYARTLQFAWNVFTPPGNHFRVQLTGIQVQDDPGTWHMWADVSGQWTYLNDLAPDLMQTQAGQVVSLPGASYDVYAQSTDTVRVFVEGYSAACIDNLFGHLFGVTSYQGGLTLIATCGTGDNTNLGAALLTLPAVPASAGQYTVAAAGGGHFQAQVTVEYVSP